MNLLIRLTDSHFTSTSALYKSSSLFYHIMDGEFTPPVTPVSEACWYASIQYARVCGM